ncbi:hypothetical protein BSNK01_13740 [Bacillaceae bacterium]
MRWSKEGLEKFRMAKEFIDTALIPVHRIPWREPEEELRRYERLQTIAESVEQRLAGRVFLLPAITVYGGENGSPAGPAAIAERAAGELQGHFPYQIYLEWDRDPREKKGEASREFSPAEIDAQEGSSRDVCSAEEALRHGRILRLALNEGEEDPVERVCQKVIALWHGQA